MLHPSGYSIYYDANALVAATMSERGVMLSTVIDGMLEGNPRAGNTAFWLGRDLAGIGEDGQGAEVSFATETSHGEFQAPTSLELLNNTERLQGFLESIKRWPEQAAVVDVGCGPFPALALAAALYHPKAEISAIEINDEAANSAEEFVRQFGLSDRVSIVNADISDHKVDPNTTAAVTETFSSALQEEPGPKIVRFLHDSGVPTITPSAAELRLSMGDEEFTQPVDLRRDTHANIAFDRGSNPGNEGKANIKAEYYDDRGLVLDYDKDQISRGLPWAEKYKLMNLLAKVGDTGQLTYELGVQPFVPHVNALEPAQT